MNYIINFQPVALYNIDYEYLTNIEEKIINKFELTNEEILYFLDCVCYLIRLKVNSNMDNFDYKCDLFQSILAHYFRNINCEVNACMTQNVITNNIVGHSFLIVKFKVNGSEQYYLLDPSYIQFFKTDKCQLSNYIINDKPPYQILLTPDPGYFIKEDKMDLALYLLNHGFIILNEETATMYGDSFLNTKSGIPLQNRCSSIPGTIYIKSFLKGNETLSKTKDELDSMGLLFSQIKKEKKL